MRARMIVPAIVLAAVSVDGAGAAGETVVRRAPYDFGGTCVAAAVGLTLVYRCVPSERPRITGSIVGEMSWAYPGQTISEIVGIRIAVPRAGSLRITMKATATRVLDSALYAFAEGPGVGEVVEWRDGSASMTVSVHRRMTVTLRIGTTLVFQTVPVPNESAGAQIATIEHIAYRFTPLR